MSNGVEERTAKHLLDWLTDDMKIGRLLPGMVGRLSTLIGSQEVVYKDTDMGPSPSRDPGRTIVVFTATHLFIQTCEPGDEGKGTVEVTVLPRKALVGLSTKGEEPVRRHDRVGQARWPWPTDVVLTYRDGTALTLPVHGAPWQMDGELAALLPSLMADLAR